MVTKDAVWRQYGLKLVMKSGNFPTLSQRIMRCRPVRMLREPAFSGMVCYYVIVFFLFFYVKEIACQYVMGRTE